MGHSSGSPHHSQAFFQFFVPSIAREVHCLLQVFARLTGRERAGTERLVAHLFSPHVFPELVDESLLSKEKIATGLQHLSIVSTPLTSPVRSEESAYTVSLITGSIQDSDNFGGVEQPSTTNSASPAYHAYLSQREQRERENLCRALSSSPRVVLLFLADLVFLPVPRHPRNPQQTAVRRPKQVRYPAFLPSLARWSRRGASGGETGATVKMPLLLLPMVRGTAAATSGRGGATGSRLSHLSTR